MNALQYDVVVIGGGPAGLAAAVKAKEYGLNTLLLDENGYLGGILPQCIHPGFGIHYFREELTGPEFYHRFVQKVGELKVDHLTNARVLEIKLLRLGKGRCIYISQGCFRGMGQGNHLCHRG